ncbi:Os08g0166000 [Oryza sativa Japonica Group]|uniref:Os08g0166000 protein n=1 Tax=Oryza sativa subsp. japonica TaxID=39947 RepID=A0A0P0XCN2_ORYSJ|nr:Os08g0166000 [Oryza sativa Japonica Group]
MESLRVCRLRGSHHRSRSHIPAAHLAGRSRRRVCIIPGSRAGLGHFHNTEPHNTEPQSRGRGISQYRTIQPRGHFHKHLAGAGNGAAFSTGRSRATASPLAGDDVGGRPVRAWTLNSINESRLPKLEVRRGRSVFPTAGRSTAASSTRRARAGAPPACISAPSVLPASRLHAPPVAAAGQGGLAPLRSRRRHWCLPTHVSGRVASC